MKTEEEEENVEADGGDQDVKDLTARDVLIRQIMGQNYADTRDLILEMPDGEAKAAAVKDLTVWTLLEDEVLTHERYEKMRDTLAIVWELYDSSVWNIGVNKIESQVYMTSPQGLREQLYDMIVSK